MFSVTNLLSEAVKSDVTTPYPLVSNIIIALLVHIIMQPFAWTPYIDWAGSHQ